MQYKTIVLNLLRQRRELYQQLKTTRKVMPTLDRFANELKLSHAAWQTDLSQARPDSDPSQIASEALEMAIKELEDRLPPVSRQDDSEPLSLEGVIDFVRR
jgi:hypothetical protein